MLRSASGMLQAMPARRGQKPSASRQRLCPECRAAVWRIVRSGAGDAFVDLEQVGGRVVIHRADGVRAIVLEDGALGVAKGAAFAWDLAHPNVEARFE